jgi:soluble lytic murein transglycosylase-like protein
VRRARTTLSKPYHPIALGAAAAILGLAAPAQAQVYQIGPEGAVLIRSSGAEAVWIESGPASPSAQADAAESASEAAYPPMIAAAALRYRLSPALLDAVARQESGYRADAVSPKGAVGVMQLTLATARALGVDPKDPAANVMGGAAYLRIQLDRFDGRIDLALAAYNAGPEAVARHGGVPPYPETLRYVKANLDRLAAELPPPGTGDAPARPETQGDDHD